MRKLASDTHGIELPIAIVVMLVVGVAALAALLAILGAAPGIPKKMVAEPEKPILIWKGEHEYTLKFHVSAAGSPVPGAECVLRGLGVTNLSKSNDEGIVTFKQKLKLPIGVDEACLELICRRAGYQEFSESCIIRVIRG